MRAAGDRTSPVCTSSFKVILRAIHCLAGFQVKRFGMWVPTRVAQFGWKLTMQARFHSSGTQTVEHADTSHPRMIPYHDAHGHIWSEHIGPRLMRFLDYESSEQTTTIPFTRFLEDKEGNVWI